MQTFIWIVDRQVSKNTRPNVNVVKFGDGYESRIGFGLNNTNTTWSVSFNNRELAEINAIESFLEARGARESFEWTPPNGAQPIAVVCREWTRSEVNSSYASIQATFQRVFEV